MRGGAEMCVYLLLCLPHHPKYLGIFPGRGMFGKWAPQEMHGEGMTPNGL